jgi:hypothetical protein
MSSRTTIAAYAVVTIVAAVRIAATHRVFSEVLDEPAHVAAGMEWLTEGRYDVDASHPPLARVLAALPARLEGIPLPAEPDLGQKGNQILYARDHYEHNLSRARLGNLILLIVLIVSTAAWARRVFPEPIPLLSIVFLTSIPALLGHAGVATTDLAVTATLPLSLLALDFYLENPTNRRGAAFGIAIGLGILSKFSFLVFFPIAAVIVIILRCGRARAVSLAVTFGAMFVVVWAGYRFQFGRIGETRGGVFFIEEPAPRFLKPAARWFAQHVPIPAPPLLIGLGIVKTHDRSGHLSYLLGRYSDRGWWYYFPVIFFFKTPIPFLILVLWGMFTIRDRLALQFVFVPIAILLVAMTSSINIGVRHILPIYPPLAIVAAFAATTIWRRSSDAFARTMLAALVAWLIISSAIAHPDYLAWFNEAAGDHPEQIAVDSNLDWGQDILRLRRAVHDLHIEKLNVLIATNAWIYAHDIVSEGLVPYRQSTGWVAVSETALALDGRHGEYRWLDVYRPVRRVGKTIRLYYIP